MKLYNSLTRTIEPFTPRHKNEIKIYVCGITPYDTTHIGHAFTYIFFDAFIRYLRFTGKKVTYTQNVTDIDDDILKRAKHSKKDWQKLGNYWTNQFLKDSKALNIEIPTHFVKATNSITSMIQIIEVLINKKYAYVNDGNVYFEWKKFADYGKLSRFSTKQMHIIAAERGINLEDKRKKDPLDFVLWQQSKADEPFWKSPWSNGRPGWHIECSAMIYEFLGEQIDIHGGGRDLVYPHHESEIAQSESFTGKKPFVQTWMHTAMVMINGEKMAKSLGNLVLVRDLLKKYSPQAIRWFLLSHHYRAPWEHDEEELENAQKIISQIMKNTTGKVLSNDNPKLDLFRAAIEHDAGIDKVLKKLSKGVINDKDVVTTILRVLGF